MARNIKISNSACRIPRYEDLITTREQTRAGFIAFALEKNRRSTPLIESAKAFRHLAARAKTAKELLSIPEIRPALLTAAGLSDKALNYFDEPAKNIAINELIKNFLEPAGEHFIDEAVYRYLLIKGDALGGMMRNIIGKLAQQKLIRALLSNLSVSGITYQWIGNQKNCWQQGTQNDFQVEETLKALSWKNTAGQNRVLALNLKLPIVGKNIDICLFDTGKENYKASRTAATKAIMLGELKGGIDPAGADEHYKTGSHALDRIRTAFAKKKLPIQTSFVAAAIEREMASEIFDQLRTKKLTYAANLTIDSQVVNYCAWLLQL